MPLSSLVFCFYVHFLYISNTLYVAVLHLDSGLIHIRLLYGVYINSEASLTAGTFVYLPDTTSLRSCTCCKFGKRFRARVEPKVTSGVYSGELSRHASLYLAE